MKYIRSMQFRDLVALFGNNATACFVSVARRPSLTASIADGGADVDICLCWWFFSLPVLYPIQELDVSHCIAHISNCLRFIRLIFYSLLQNRSVSAPNAIVVESKQNSLRQCSDAASSTSMQFLSLSRRIYKQKIAASRDARWYGLHPLSRWMHTKTLHQ